MGQALTQGLSPPADPSVRTLQPTEKGAVRYTGASGYEHQPVANDAKSADEGFRREVEQRWLEEDKALAEHEMKDLLVNSEQRIASLTERLDNIRKVHDAQMQALEEEIERVERDIEKGSKDDQVTATLVQNLEVLKQTKNHISARHTHDISYVITTASRGYPQPRPELHDHQQHHHQGVPRPRPGGSASAPVALATAAGSSNNNANLGAQAAGSRQAAAGAAPALHKSSASTAGRAPRAAASAVRLQQHQAPPAATTPAVQHNPTPAANPAMASVTYDLSGAAPEGFGQDPAPAFVPAPAQSLPQLPVPTQHNPSVGPHGHPYYDPTSVFDGLDTPARASGIQPNQGLTPMTMGT